jgi:hypothetical protein
MGDYRVPIGQNHPRQRSLFPIETESYA